MTDDFSAAAPRPWSEHGMGGCECGQIFGPDGNAVICIVQGPMHLANGPDCVPDREAQRANARLIVAAVNTYCPQPEPVADDVERVARALARRRVEQNLLREGREETPEFYQRVIDHAWSDFTVDARAAIVAMPQVEELRAERDALRQALAGAEGALEKIGREPNVGNWVFAQAFAALARIREINRREDMTKLTPPPLSPSAEEMMREAASEAMRFGWSRTLPDHFTVAHQRGFRVGIDAVIALLREPDEAMLNAMWRAYDSTEGESMRSVAAAQADLLEAHRG